MKYPYNIDKIYVEIIVDVQNVGFHSIENHDIKRKLKYQNIKEINCKLLTETAINVF